MIGDCDGLADVVVERYGEAVGGRATANCDACVYRVALPGHEGRVGTPQVPHHHPAEQGEHVHDHRHVPV